MTTIKFQDYVKIEFNTGLSNLVATDQEECVSDIVETILKKYKPTDDEAFGVFCSEKNRDYIYNSVNLFVNFGDAASELFVKGEASSLITTAVSSTIAYNISKLFNLEPEEDDVLMLNQSNVDKIKKLATSKIKMCPNFD